jgi:hypothetical protein
LKVETVDVPEAEADERQMVGSVSFRACSGAISGRKAYCSSSFQNTQRDGHPMHILKAPGSGGNMLAHMVGLILLPPRFSRMTRFAVCALMETGAHCRSVVY